MRSSQKYWRFEAVPNSKLARLGSTFNRSLKQVPRSTLDKLISPRLYLSTPSGSSDERDNDPAVVCRSRTSAPVLDFAVETRGGESPLVDA
ncbi:hypothetical protein E4U38_000068 [Claviceps purpurea]|nr:hypothetical protein E4U38_000068 [Claviceps purpurea]